METPLTQTMYYVDVIEIHNHLINKKKFNFT